MRIILINPKKSGHVSKIHNLLQSYYPPLGLVHIGSVLEKAGHQVKIIDAEAEGLSDDIIRKRIMKFQPEFCGIHTNTWTFKSVKKLAKQIKNWFQNIKIILGGPHLVNFGELSLKECSSIDYGVVGEGEETIVDLLNNLENPQKVKGIIYRDGKVIKTEPRPYIENLDKLPLPAWHLLPMGKYKYTLGRRKGFAILFSSRGCPYNCIFCDSKERFGKTTRYRSVESLIEEIDLLYNQHKVREIIFYDDTFTLNKQRIYDLCQRLEKYNLLWECRTRINCVDYNLLKAMTKAGCYRIRFGVESGNQRILNILKKGITLEQARDAFKWCKELNIKTFAYCMIGNPTETEKEMEETINFVLELDPDYAVFSATRAINKGTELFKWAVENSKIEENYWERFIKEEVKDGAPLLYPHTRKWVKKAYRRFYFRPSYILKTLWKCRNLRNLLIYFRIGLNILIKGVEF